MLGYIMPYKDELKMKEYEIYSGYYCGICKSVGRRYGQLPRFTLSYDFVFLAMLLASITDDADEILKEHCIIHHIKKKAVLKENQAVEYAADVMLLLAYYKMKDDYSDDKSMKAGAASLALTSSVKKIGQKYEALGKNIYDRLQELSLLEKEKCDSVDRACEPFAQIMTDIFSEGIPKELKNEQNIKLLKHIGYHLGKWIYLLDAYEDIEENLEKHTYNPLFYRFDYNFQGENTESFRERIRADVEFNLIHYLAEIGNALDLLEMRKNKGIIENVAYFGLHRKTEEVLQNKKAKSKNEGNKRNRRNA